MKVKGYEAAFFVVGVVAIGLMIHSIGWHTLAANLRRIGWWAVPIVGLRLIVYAINTRAWQLLTFYSRGQRHLIPFRKMLQMVISGYAINYITPVMALGGEPYRILEMKKYLGTAKATSSVITYSALHILSHFLFWNLGCVLMLCSGSAGVATRMACWGFIIVNTLCVLAIVRGYRRGVAVAVAEWLLRVPLLRKIVARWLTPATRHSLVEIDNGIRNLYRSHSANLVKATVWETTSRVIGSLEVYIILLAVGINISIGQAIIVSSISSLFANLLFFSPMQLGTREGGLALAIKSIGLAGTTGVVVGIAMRIAELFWIAVGIALIETTKLTKTRHMKEKTHAYIFDYGGTLDTNGTHWFHIFLDRYRHYYPHLTENNVRQAYIYTEQTMAHSSKVSSSMSFKEVLELKIQLQHSYLLNNFHLSDVKYKNDIVNDCYYLAYQNTTQAKATLQALHKANKLAIVSNFYGNLSHVIDDFGLSSYFETIVDSGNEGVAKPDKEIFMLAVKRLNLSPECCTVVGDSYHKDIMPAKAIGCRTIWLNQKGWNNHTGTTSDADIIISSIAELETSD